MTQPRKIDFGQRLVSKAELALLDKRVLFTAPRHYAGNLARYLVERGARPVWMPTIAIYPLDDYTDFDRALQNLGDYAWVALTSLMGSQAFVNRLRETGLGSETAKKTRITAFGPDSIPLDQLGIKPDLVPGVSYPSVMLGEMVKIGPPGGRVLVPVPEVRDVTEPFVIPEFISELERAGMVPHRVPAYMTIATSEANQTARASLLAGEIDITVITSSAEIFSLLDQLDGDRAVVNRTTVAFMGEYTARTGREMGINVDILPQEFSMPGLVAAIEDHFRYGCCPKTG
ncbi:MAG: uroporphyrinogen-III synthase [Dehalococcoidia bacterium]|jgi:uroporphyrinogen-III synthase|nr:MAG: uroporphyrinogen-III synthase [Dehalococcoidia bacterium]